MTRGEQVSDERGYYEWNVSGGLWKVTDELDAVLDRIEQQQELPEPVLPAGITARQFMQMVMRGELEPTPRQMSAAKALIEYEEPKLTAVAVGHFDQSSFAAQLERCIARSKSPPPPAALPAPQHPASEVKGPFVTRRRNLR